MEQPTILGGIYITRCIRLRISKDVAINKQEKPNKKKEKIEENWNVLFDQIVKGNVIPVIGPNDKRNTVAIEVNNCNSKDITFAVI